MAAIRSRTRQRRFGAAQSIESPQPQATQPARIPSPILGVNFYDSLSAQGPQDAIYAYNMNAEGYGLATRKGYRDWVTGVGPSLEVRTLMPLTGTDGLAKLFATTADGIWDVTSSDDAPVISLEFGIQTGAAGWGTFTVYNNDGGDFYLIYADEVNGLFEYDVAGGTWAVKSDITGLDGLNAVFVVEHQERLWFIERNTMNSWYLEIGVKGGAATQFNLGNKFNTGGYLLGMYHWSVDGGDGVTDYLVFVSSAGAVAVYRGLSPEDALTWSSIGTWAIGAPPISRKVGHKVGGELHLLSSFGLVSMQDLVSGVNIERATGQNTIARKITRPIRNDMQRFLEDYAWDMVNVHSENAIILVRPFVANTRPGQYIFNFTTAGWTFWRDIPITSAAEVQGRVFFGTDDGRILLYNGGLDGSDINGEGGQPVEFSMLTSYQDWGLPGQYKRVQMTRPTFFSEGGEPPEYTVQPLYDYEVSEPLSITPPVAGDQPGGEWDVSLWDQAVWGGANSTSSRLVGGKGMGFMTALAIAGKATSRATLLDTIVYFDTGGLIG